MNAPSPRAPRRPDQHLPAPPASPLFALVVAVGLGCVRRRRRHAQRRYRPSRPDEVKFDALLQDADAGDDDDLPVIVEFNDDTRRRRARQRPRRPPRASACGGMRGRTTRMSKRMLRQLARRGDVKRVHYDRPVEALLGRTVDHRRRQDRAAALMGFTGTGIGVAVIDSGVTPNHDDLRYAGSYAAARHQVRGLRRHGHQRPTTTGATARTSPASSPATATTRYGTRAGIAPAATLVALKALDGDGKGRISTIIAGARLGRRQPRRLQHPRRQHVARRRACSSPTTPTRSPSPPSARSTPASWWSRPPATSARTPTATRSTAPSPRPANAPWVLTVGAANTQRHHPPRRRHDGAVQLARARRRTTSLAKPDVVAPGTGVASLSSPGSKMYVEKAQYLIERLALHGRTSRISR